MPRPASWLPRLAEIRRSVNNSQRSHYTRRDLELLCKISPRAAGKLLELLATDRAGSSHLVARETLQEFLEAVREADDVPALFDRLRAEKANITRVRARYMHLSDSPDMRDSSLPRHIALERGDLRIQFETGEQLVESLMLIAAMISGDPAGFEARFDPVRPLDRSAEAEDGRYIESEIARLGHLLAIDQTLI